MKARFLPLAWAFVGSVAWAGGDLSVVQSSGVVLGTSFVEAAATASPVPSGIRVQLVKRFSAFGVDLGTADWSQLSHVRLKFKNNLTRPSLYTFGIESGPDGWAYTTFFIGGGSTAEFLLPLDKTPVGGAFAWPSVDGQTSQVQLHGRLYKDQLRKLKIFNNNRTGTQDVTVVMMEGTYVPPPATFFMDKYGQQTIPFLNKIESDADFANQVQQENALSGAYPYKADAYGGMAGTATFFSNTGRWHTAKQNLKWYIITPAGNRFFSMGVGYVGSGTWAFVSDHESMWADGAPTATGPLADCMYQDGSTLAMNIYQANWKRKYGPNWFETGMQSMSRRLKTWGINTTGSGSPGRITDPDMKTPSVAHVGIAGDFKSIPVWFGAPMPDVFDPKWAPAAKASLAPTVAKYLNNPYNMGMFVDNEMSWAFHPAEPNGPYQMVFGVLSADASQPAKQKLYKTLLATYKTIGSLNTAWKTAYASWDALLAERNFQPATMTAGLTKDASAFLTTFASTYFTTVKSALTSLGYKGMYLGCRFAYYTPEVLAAARRSCDVISFNAYDLTLSAYRDDLKALDYPVLDSEFAFTASGSGRLGGDIPSFSEEDRVQVYKNYVADAKTWKNLVGMHWYKMDDDPACGRLWDNCNFTGGLVSITDQPYQPMIDAMTQASLDFQKRLLTP